MNKLTLTLLLGIAASANDKRGRRRRRGLRKAAHGQARPTKRR
jgi:hypothetical protein